MRLSRWFFGGGVDSCIESEQHESSQPGGFSPASDLGRRSVLRRTVGSRWRHSRRHTTPRRSADLRPPPRRPSRRRPSRRRPSRGHPRLRRLPFRLQRQQLSGASRRDAGGMAGGATRPSSGLLVGMRWLGRLQGQRYAAAVQLPCARVRAYLLMFQARGSCRCLEVRSSSRC